LKLNVRHYFSSNKNHNSSLLFIAKLIASTFFLISNFQFTCCESTSIMSDNTTSSVTMQVACNGLLLMGGRLLFKNKLLPRSCRSTRQIGAQQRRSMQVDDIYQQLGPRIFRQAYRMTYTSFKRLHQKLRLRILEGLSQQPGGDYWLIPNGKITTSVCLACALCYFAGGWPGFCLFGDNAYINSIFMATPFAGVLGGSEDAYNFYHLQVQIRIECAFRMFTQQWSLLWRALPAQITTGKAVALVVALGKLHNFCIDKNDGDATPLRAADEWNLQVEGAIPTADVEPLPIELLDGGNHFDDVDRVTRRRLVQRGNIPGLPRHVLHNLVSTANFTRPNLTRTRTNN
jgi:hypothetical protein